MKLLPAGRADLLSYLRTHIPIWQADPEAVGLAPERVADLAALLEEAGAAFANAQVMRNEARAATLASNLRLGGLRESAAAVLGTIKSFARNQQNSGAEGGAPAVYAAAGIDLPLDPAPLPAPGPVQDPRIAVDTRGRPTIAWKPPHPRDARERAASSSGLTYTVQRKRPGEADYTIVAAGKMLHITDEPLAAGATMYMVRAQRGEAAGPWTFPLQVEAGVGVGGVGGGGGVAAVRMAAA
ncbi:MAG TPA: hypothetical protein VHC70_13970 [Phycisphaerales bacterium]|nr:hypothetical protein [Phycisphaerales bacterium]